MPMRCLKLFQKMGMVNKGITLVILVAFGVTFNMHKAAIAGASQINNIWVIENKKVCKVTSKHELKPVYYNNLLGKPAAVDATDPFRIVVFYQQHQQIAILDNHGSSIGNTISIAALNLGEVTLVCRSSRGGVWLYHRETNELLLTNPQGNRIVSQFSLTQQNRQVMPNLLTEANGIIYLGFGSFIHRYNSYGVKLEPLSISYEKTFMVLSKHLWIVDNGVAECRPLSNPSIVESTFKFPLNRNTIVIGSHLYFIKDGKLNPSEKL